MHGMYQISYLWHAGLTESVIDSVLSPGRFFATNNIKSMFAYILLNYDVKMAGDGGHPTELFFGFQSMPDPTAKIMFRKRQS